MGTRLGIIVAIVSLSLAACTSVEKKLLKQGAKQAYSTDIVRLVSGRTVYGTNSTGKRFLIFFSPKGSMKMSAGKGKLRDSGKWKVKNSKLCYAWTKWKKGNDCEKVFVMPNGKVVYTTGTGKKGSFDAFRNGNVEKL